MERVKLEKSGSSAYRFTRASELAFICASQSLARSLAPSRFIQKQQQKIIISFTVIYSFCLYLCFLLFALLIFLFFFLVLQLFICLVLLEVRRMLTLF